MESSQPLSSTQIKQKTIQLQPMEDLGLVLGKEVLLKRQGDLTTIMLNNHLVLLTMIGTNFLEAEYA